MKIWKSNHFYKGCLRIQKSNASTCANTVLAVILMIIQDGRQCLCSKKLNIHYNWIHVKEQTYFIGMSWTCKKNLVNQTIFLWVTVLWNMFINDQKSVFLNISKNIYIWILHKEQKLYSNKYYMCVPYLVKIDWELIE